MSPVNNPEPISSGNSDLQTGALPRTAIVNSVPPSPQMSEDSDLTSPLVNQEGASVKGASVPLLL